MKNQYFGDVNDYRKYGILRQLANNNIKILICWMLTPNDSGNDGNFIEYLNDPNKWRIYDPELFDALKEEVMTRKQRDVGCVKELNLIQHASFVDSILDGTQAARSSWLVELRQHRKNTDLVFFDPDNGIEVASYPKTRRDSKKYIYWDELEETWQSGMSLLVYQHFRREKRDHFITRLGNEFLTRLGATEIYAIRTAHVVFFLVPQPRHAHQISKSMQLIANVWDGQIQIYKVRNPDNAIEI